MLERNVFHRSAPEPMGEAGVVDDASAADVYAVVAVQRARRDKVRGERRFLAGKKEGVAYMVGAPVHGSDTTRACAPPRLNNGFGDTLG